MKKILIFIIAFFIFGCDPEDKRLIFINNSSDSLVVRMLFDNELPNKPVHWNRAREITIIPHSNKKLSIFNKWEGEFDRSQPDTLLNIIAVPYYNIDDKKNRWDSIYNAGNYYIKKISLEEIKQSNWKLEYPKEFSKK